MWLMFYSGVPEFHVDADKGFLFSSFDDSFVCQKKNHFQLTMHVDMRGTPAYVKTNTGALKHVDSCYLHFYGIKVGLFPAYLSAFCNCCFF